MTVWICATCANHYPDTDRPPAGICIICADERQWVPPNGQRWTTLAELREAGHRSDIREVEPGLLGIGSTPDVAIGQRSLVVRTEAGNLLWDPNGYLDDAAIAAVRDIGGLVGVAASHPHFYASIVEWAHAFDAPILLPEADAHWLTRPDPLVQRWSGTLEVVPGVTLVQCGGHFAGSAVVHWAAGFGGAGVLLVGDTLMVTPGEDRVTFLRSAPNRLPLPPDAVRKVADAIAPYRYDRIYGGWWEPVLRHGAKDVVRAGAQRYVEWLTGTADSDW
jgi:hypothetical protein